MCCISFVQFLSKNKEIYPIHPYVFAVDLLEVLNCVTTVLRQHPSAVSLLEISRILPTNLEQRSGDDITLDQLVHLLLLGSLLVQS
jgi:hypothetical protein